MDGSTMTATIPRVLLLLGLLSAACGGKSSDESLDEPTGGAAGAAPTTGGVSTGGRTATGGHDEPGGSRGGVQTGGTTNAGAAGEVNANATAGSIPVAAVAGAGGDSDAPFAGGPALAGAPGGWAGAPSAGRNGEAAGGTSGAAGAPTGGAATDAGAGGEPPDLCAGVDCDDGNPCTVDSCSAGACSHDGTGVSLACDDGNACTTGDACQGDEAGTCAGEDTSATRCDDANACTLDSCDAALGCSSALILSYACRPSIVVTTPERAATIQGTSDGVVTVTGSVTSGAGPITTLTLNGQTVAVADDGAFSSDLTPTVGTNVVELVATDALGSTRTVVQAFQWSTSFRLPDEPEADPVPGAIAHWMSASWRAIRQAISTSKRSWPAGS